MMTWLSASLIRCGFPKSAHKLATVAIPRGLTPGPGGRPLATVGSATVGSATVGSATVGSATSGGGAPRGFTPGPAGLAPKLGSTVGLAPKLGSTAEAAAAKPAAAQPVTAAQPAHEAARQHVAAVNPAGGAPTMLTTAPTVLTTAPTMVPGDRVRMSGLVARADLNGKYGNVVSFDDKDGRYTVSVEGGGAVSGIVSLKPTNLSKVSPGEGAGAAGAAAPAATSAAYTAAAAAPASAAFTTSSLPASPDEWIGLWVLLGGLVSRADLNGRYGTVLSYEAQYGRWAFLMTFDGPLMGTDGLRMASDGH